MLVINAASSYQRIDLSIQLLCKENLFYISSFTYPEFFMDPATIFRCIVRSDPIAARGVQCTYV